MLPPLFSTDKLLVRFQSRLTEKLQLLRLLSTSPLQISRALSLIEMIEGGLVDAISLCLQGPRLGDTTVTTLDRSQGLTFILMRNRAIDVSDRQAALDFFHLFNHPLRPVDVLRFVVTTCTANLNKTRRKVATSFAIDLLRIRLADYEPSSLQSEFKISEAAVGIVSTKFKTTDAKEVLSLCLTRLQTELLQDIQKPVSDEGVAELHRLINTAKLFNVSIFFASMLSETSPEHDMDKFRRRLAKLIRYDTAAISIVAIANRFAPHNTAAIKHRWVEMFDDDQLPLSPIVVSPSPTDVASRVLQSKDMFIEHLRYLHPDLSNLWSSSVQPAHHLEILLLCHMHMEENAIHLKPCHNQLRLIGSSKASCPCCHIALESYNERYSTRWQTARTDGRSYVDWSVTGVPWIDQKMTSWADSELVKVFNSLEKDVSRSISPSVTVI